MMLRDARQSSEVAEQKSFNGDLKHLKPYTLKRTL